VLLYTCKFYVHLLLP